MRCTSFQIRHHLRKKHSMTLQEYENKFYDSLKDELSEAETKTRAAVHPGYDKSIMDKTNEATPECLKSRRRSHGCNLVWNYQIYFCPSCPSIFYSERMAKVHLAKKKIDASYAIPGPFHIHECKLCKMNIKCSFKNIKCHLINEHSMKLLDYEQKFYNSLRDELSRVEAKFMSVAHTGFDPNFSQGETQTSQGKLVTEMEISDETIKKASREWSPMLVPVESAVPDLHFSRAEDDQAMELLEN